MENCHVIRLKVSGHHNVPEARDYGNFSWLSYEVQFRRIAVAKNLITGWGRKDDALWITPS